jgi:hypothetical protein
MSSLAIAVPYPGGISATSGSGVDNLLTRSPKEVYQAGASSGTLTWDFGSTQPFDTVYLGSTNAPPGAQWSVSYGIGSGTETIAVPTEAVIEPGLWFGVDRRYPVHFYAKLPAPVSARYVAIQFSGAPAFQAGKLVVSVSFQPENGREFGSGRQMIDTGSAESLLDGGFGIEDGVVKSMFRWTMGDLSDAEVAIMEAIARRSGTTRPVIVCEDPDRTPGLQERLHYGLFGIEAFERTAPGATRWGLSVTDWL